MSPGARLDPRHLAVGHLAKAHGIKGELYVQPLTDHPEETYTPGVVLSFGRRTDDGPTPDLPPLRIRASRPFRKGYLVSFDGLDDRTQAEALRGAYAYREASEVEPPAEGEIFHHELVGMEVVLRGGERLGEVSHLFELQPADLLEVRGPEKEYLIPFLDRIVVEIDAERRRVIVDPPDGLLDL